MMNSTPKFFWRKWYISVLLLFIVISAQAQVPFITIWKTDNPGVSNSSSIIIPARPGLTGYNYDVDWDNDGTYDEFGITSSITHDFGTPGTYTISIRGSIPQLYHYYTVDHDAEKLLEIKQWGDIAWISMGNAFSGCKNMVLTATDAPDLSQVTDVGFMFDGCQNLNTDIEHWDVSNVEEFSFLFRGCKLFNQPLNNWDVSSSTSFTHTFDGCEVFNQPLDKWDLSNVTTISAMFIYCTAFNQDIGGWDVSNVTLFDQVFSKATNFNQDITGWDVSNGTKFVATFAYTNAFNQDISGWNMSNAILTNSMFLAARAFTYNLASWDVSNVENMSYMFSQAIFNQDISAWNTGKVTDMSKMFWNNQVFNQPIGSWDVSSVTNMSEMFRGAEIFDQDLSSWDVSKVINMQGMFMATNEFNQDIGNWNVGLVEDFSGMFNLALKFDQDIGGWNVSSATDMNSMFNQNPVFNQDISGWNVGNVTDLSSMFRSATSFNQELRAWDVSKVTDMSTMFQGNTAFDQNIGDWDVSNVTTMFEMFRYNTLSTSNYDSLLIGWNKLTLQPGVDFHAGNSTYCASASARANMITSDGWAVTDGGTSDAVVPAIVCQDITITLDSDGNATITADMLDGGTTDDCSSTDDLVFSASQTSFGCSDIGDITVTLTVTDFEGNSDTCDATVTVVAPAVSITSCPSDISITASGCSAIATWTVPSVSCGSTLASTHNSGDTFPLGSTTVTYTATHPDGSTAICSFDVNVTGGVSVSFITSSNESCYGESDGQAFINVTGGTSPYTYDWDYDGTGDFDDVKNQSGLTSGDNVVTVRDASGCEQSLTINIDYDPLEIYNCPSDITVLTNSSGCEAIVVWSAPKIFCSGATLSSTHSIGDTFGIGTTTVTYTATNAVETVYCSFDVTVYNDLTATLDGTTNTSCFDSSDGTASLTITGGVAPYTYDWDNDGTGDFDDAEDPTDLPIGTINYVVQDATGCEVSGSVDIISDPLAITGCPSDIIQITNTAGCQAIVNWSLPVVNCTGATFTSTHNSGDVFGIGTTTVTYTASNGIGEVVTCSFDVTVYNDLTANEDGTTNTSCFDSTDGTASLTVTGGVAPYTYDWDNDGTGDFDDAEDPVDLPIGTNNYTVRDATGCEVSGSVDIISDPLEITGCPTDITILTNTADCQAVVNWSLPTVTCTGATLTSTHNSGDVFGIGTTTVIYTASNTIGEIVSCSFDVTVYNDLAASVNGTTNASCFDSIDGTASLTITGGVAPYTYDWDHDGTGDFDDVEDPTDLPRGVNSYTIRDATGCEVNGSVTIDSDPLEIDNCPTNITVLTNTSGCQAIVNWSLPVVNCTGATLTSTHNPGDVFGIGTTTVIYTASNTIGEIVTCSFDVTVYNDLAASVNGTTNASCFDSIDGTASLTITGGVAPYTYDWDNDSTGDFDDVEDPVDLPIGTNNYTVRDATGCEVSGSVTIDSDPLEIDNCPTNITVLTNTSGCQAIVNWSLPMVNCTGATLTSTHNSGDVFGIGTTTVTYTASNTIGEVVTCSFDVTVTSDLSVTSIATNSTCFDQFDGSAELIISGGVGSYDIDWHYDGVGDYDDNLMASNMPLGNNTYSIRDALGCVQSGSVTIGLIPLQLINCPEDIVVPAEFNMCKAIVTWDEPDTNCPGITITSTHSSGDFFDFGTTTVVYTASDASGQVATCSFDVNVESDLRMDFAEIVNPLCYDSLNGQVTISVSGGVSPHQLKSSGSFDNLTNEIIVDNLGGGTHSFTIKDDIGCEVTDEVILIEPDSIMMSVELQDTQYGKWIDLSISGGTLPYINSWSGDGINSDLNNEDIEVLKNGVFVVDVLDNQNCPATLQVEISTLSDYCDNLEFSVYPNPNDGDFSIDFSSCAKPVEIHIYDMVGKMILVERHEGLTGHFTLPSLSSGQYIVKVVSGGNINTRIMSIQ